MTENPASLRLFVAIDLPPELQSQIAARRPALEGLHWAPPERLHLTLAFIGAASCAQARQIDQALSEIRFAPFNLEIDRLGQFHRRHLWLAPAPSAALDALQQAVVEALANCGLPQHQASFVPHITLARLQRFDLRRLEPLEHALLLTPLGLRVDQFCMKNSRLTAKGALHQVLTLYNAST